MRQRRVYVWFVMAALVGLTACSSSTTGGSGPVTVTPQGSIPWLAFQDGNGAWTLLSGTTFTVTDPAGRYGLAWVCTYTSSPPEVNVVQATTGESASATVDCPPATILANITVSGTLQGMQSTDTGYVAIGTLSTSPINSPFNYSVTPAQGSHTLVAYGRDQSGAPTTMLVRPSVSFYTSQTGYNLDLSSSAAASFTDATATLTNYLQNAGLNMYAYLLSPTTGRAKLASGSTSSLTVPVVPASLRGQDIFLLSGLGASGQEVDRTVTSIAGQVSLPLPSTLSSGSIGVANGIATASWGSVTFGQTGGVTLYVADVDPLGVTTSPRWHVAATTGWLGTNSAYTFPDLTSTSGWQAAWNFPTGINASARTSVLHANLALSAAELFLQTLAFRSFPAGVTLERSAVVSNGTY